MKTFKKSFIKICIILVTLKIGLNEIDEQMKYLRGLGC